MTAVTQALYNVLSGDATLTALLGQYASQPSIFTKIPLPKDVTLENNGPYILATGPAATVPGSYDTKNSGGLEVLRDVRCYQDDRGDSAVIEQISERVRTLFHRVPPSVSGYTVEIAEVSGPIEADEEDALGRIVTVRLVMSAN